MMSGEKRWTDAQLKAINSDADSILVSAAAGSGKTAVMTRRIIQKLTSSEHPCDISRMLIVTFTRASAAELKERISVALTEACAADPSNRHLRRQLMMLPCAHISTIHSFCLDLIRAHAQRLGFDVRVKVCDDSRVKFMTSEIMEDTIDKYYDMAAGEGDIPDFVGFSENFFSVRDTGFSDALISIYNKLRTFPEGIDYLPEFAKKLDDCTEKGFFDGEFGGRILSSLSAMLDYYADVMKKALEYIDENSDFLPYAASFRHDLEFIDKIRDAVSSRDGDAIRNFIGEYKPLPLSRVKSELQTDTMISLRDERMEFSKSLRKFGDRYFVYSNEEIASDAEASAKFCMNLHKILGAFDRSYTAEKRKYSLVDFADLERLAVKLLYNGDGTPSDIARSCAEDFDEIYIDEYQDVNRLQDLILSAPTHFGTKRFMVGDIKQSIYGFRAAEPSLFAGYRKNDDVESIFLSHNFRCDGKIVDFVNTVCGFLMKNGSPSSDYLSEDDLVYGKTGGDIDSPVEIALVRTSDDDEENFSSSDTNPEAEFVADRISKLLHDGCSAGDICILLRSAESSSVLFENALQKRGIPYYNQVARSLFESPEILLVMCILGATDNPGRDIPLTGALKSPIFGFSLEELILIKSKYKDLSLFEAMKLYAETDASEKCRFALDKLAKWRAYARTMPVDRLLWNIYEDTNLISLVCSGCDDKTSSGMHGNLMLLYDYARKFESGAFRGLHEFIAYVDEIISSGTTVENARTVAEGKDAVNIMTVHKSKGLEFPVCFLCGAAKKLNSDDTKQKLIVDYASGVTMKLTDKTGLALKDTAFRLSSALSVAGKSVEEEMRVLYVALTRAKNRLIVTALSRDPEKMIEEAKSAASLGVCGYPYALTKNPSYIKWILSALFFASSDSYVISINDTAFRTENTDDREIESEPIYDEDRICRLKKEFETRFGFVYVRPEISVLPAKISVSKLYPAVLDEDGEVDDRSGEKEVRLRVPKFVSEEKRTYSAAERGTATHVFMQFCDFSHGRPDVREEAQRLVDRGFIPEYMRDIADFDAIERFFDGELFASMLSARRIWRETRFNVLLPAKNFTQNPELAQNLDGENILVQGVIDCFFVDAEGKLVLLDYKTDSVPRGMSAAGEEFDEYLTSRHKMQLTYYRAACENMLCRKVDRVLIYSFAAGRPIDITETTGSDFA